MAANDLILYRRTEELLYKIYPRLINFPKSEKFSLCQSIKNSFFDLLTNINLDKLDQYCKRALRLKYFVRYMDDVIAVVRSKARAVETQGLIAEFLADKLRLQVNRNKTKIFPINQGVNAIGFKIHPTHRLLRNDNKKRTKRKAKKIGRLLVEGAMTVEKAEQILNSCKGHADHGCSYNFIKRLVERNDYLYLDNKGALRVDVSKINKRRGLYAAN